MYKISETMEVYAKHIFVSELRHYKTTHIHIRMHTVE